MELEKLIHEFCNTAAEWHYLVCGISIGWSAGIVTGMWFMLKVVEVA